MATKRTAKILKANERKMRAIGHQREIPYWGGVNERKMHRIVTQELVPVTPMKTRLRK